MKFGSVEAAWHFWHKYGAHTSFRVRVRYKNKKKEDDTITSCPFVYCKKGVQTSNNKDTLVNIAKTRTNCKARISLTLKNESILYMSL